MLTKEPNAVSDVPRTGETARLPLFEAEAWMYLTTHTLLSAGHYSSTGCCHSQMPTVTTAKKMKESSKHTARWEKCVCMCVCVCVCVRVLACGAEGSVRPMSE